MAIKKVQQSEENIERERQLIERELIKRQLAVKNYRHYLYYVHGEAWQKTRMSDFLSQKVQEFLEEDTGNAYDILVIETPPQHGKSMTLTESLPSWVLMKHPETRVIISSYNEESAERFSRRNREKVQQFGTNLFGVTVGSLNRATEFELMDCNANAQGRPQPKGRLISRGIMQGITGHSANLLIIDDPVKNREEADSSAYRERLWGEWLNSLKSRLSAKAKIIIIMTPWHEDDLAARVLETESSVQLIRLPVEAEEDDMLGRKPGEPLCPELGKNEIWLEQFKKAYMNDPSGGTRAWAALYMCSPRVEGGNILQREKWKYYHPDSMRGKGWGTTIISVDAAFKGRANNDFVAIQVWSKRYAQYYLRYGINKHLTFFDTISEIRRIRELFPETLYVIIEDKANGPAIIEALQKEMIGVVGVNPKGDKVSRVNRVQAIIEGGNAYLPDDQIWISEFVDQCAAFPGGKHDDMVDSMSQALTWLTWGSGNTGLPMTESEVRERDIYRDEQSILAIPNMYNVYSQGPFDFISDSLSGGADYIY